LIPVAALLVVVIYAVVTEKKHPRHYRRHYRGFTGYQPH
jgi:hypothetical protein